MQKSVAGTITLDGAPLGGVELVLTDEAGTALQALTADARGEFGFVPPAGFARGWVVARLHAPIVGAAAVAAGPDAPVALALSSSNAATLTVTVRPPTGVAFDWAMLAVNPRSVPGVPDAVVAAAALVGTGPAVRGAYHELRLTGPEARLRVLPGGWGLAVSHVVERSPSPLEEPAPSWIHDTLVLTDGTRLGAPTGEHRVTVTGDLAATLETKALAPGR